MSSATPAMQPKGANFVQTVSTTSGANLKVCLQCRKCSSGCPVAARADITAHQVVRLVQLGQEDEVLSSRMIWECTSCQTCITRCPQKVDIPAMMDGLRRLAKAAGKTTKETKVPAFNEIFLSNVQSRGRMYEMGLMASFKLRTGDLFADVDKFPMMLKKGKLPLLPSKKVRGGSDRKAMFERARKSANGGKGGQA
ncbi:MAG TPA: 4Fe-4S dicluster domain-containing protein [Planctomycetota bacterium]|jgi:heterodisulfide reductase subunit C